MANRWSWWIIPILISGVAAAQQAPQNVPAPVGGRFEVFRTSDGFTLWGFRASVGESDRFTLRVGMPAPMARAQMLTIQWDWTYGLMDPRSLELWGSRVLYGHITETVAVILDPAGQRVQTVAYSRQPADFSREGLERYLAAAFQEGRTVADDEGRILMEYGPRDGQILRVEATRLDTVKPQWRLVYRIDATGAASG